MARHTGLISRFNAWLLSRGSSRYNEIMNGQKRRLFSGLSGRVLEIGPGTGANLGYYPNDVSLVIGLEPSPYMQQYLNKEAAEFRINLEVITGKAEQIPLSAGSVDAVVSTLVLCSVEDVARSLSEIERVLKPGGTFLFIEHVAAPEHSFLRTVQRSIKPIWKWMADGCHPDRETWKAVENAGFSRVEIEHFRLPLAVIGPHIIGTAVK